ncbi:MAG TPA: isoamylase early set domain-containing protein [Bacteroidales bacterium]
MSLKKQYSKTKPVCKVTFALAKDIVASATKVNVTGDFNNWDIESTPMKKAKSGEFTASVELEKGREYQFKYVIDGKEWINETEADKFVPNEFKSENSVVIV